MKILTYELEEIEHKIISYLNNSIEHKIICEEPAEFLTKMIGKRVSVVQVERALNRLEGNNLISINSLKSKSRYQNLKIVQLIL